MRASQIGPGYVLRQRPDGHGVAGFVTLDLCGFRFPSEQLRTDRIQVNYVAPGHAVELSNEVVTYRPGGAEQALHEITHAASHCPRGAVPSAIEGVSSITYRLHRIVDTRLPHGSLALLLHLVATVNGRPFRQTSVTVYQTRRDILSGVYTSSGSIADLPALVTFNHHAANWFHIASDWSSGLCLPLSTHGRAAAAENQPRRSDEFGRKLTRHGIVLP